MLFSFIWWKTANFAYDKLAPYPSFCAEEWLESGSDLLCSVFTQAYPRIPNERPNVTVPRTGRNHFPLVEDMRSATWSIIINLTFILTGHIRHTVSYSQDHLLITAPDNPRKQIEFYRELLATLRNLDALHGVPSHRRHSLERARKGSVEPAQGFVHSLPGAHRPKAATAKKRKQTKKLRARS